MTMEELNEYRELEAEIRHLRRLLIRMESRLQGMASGGDGMPRGKGGVHDALGDGVAELVDVQARLQRRMVDSAAAMRRIVSSINAVPNAQMRNILLRRYVSGWSWRRIGVDMGIDETTAMRRHNRFFAAVQDMQDKPG